MRRFLIPCLLLGLGLSQPSASTAGELAGVTVDDSVEVGGETLVLNGMGLRKKIGFKVYVGALYLEQKSSDESAILGADEPRRTDMVFMRKVSTKQLCGAWEDCLRANAPAATADVEKGFERLCGLMQDVGKDDRMVASYVPGEGTEIRFGDGANSTIGGKGFADTLFSCWIGSAPATADLKRGMLGQ